jgi:signal transduction histidine kinase/phage shock protein PspC (stress-responsive transcriptional regulator)
MATPAAPPAAAPAPQARLRRDPVRGKVGGVAAGLAGRLGVDPLAVRLAFVLATVAGGWGAALYVLLWVAIPPGDGTATSTRFRTGRSSVEVGLGAALLLLAAMLVARETGMWWSDAVIWPVVLVAGGAALLWRQSLADPEEAPAAAEAVAVPGPEADRLRARRRAAVASRTGLGVVLVLGAGVAILFSTGALGAARDVAVAAVVVVVALAIILAPFAARLLRSLSDERATRVREQERAEVAAHLHDSVLQTLALMQQRADDPRQVATLARRQERELRAWLGRRPGDGTGADGAPTLGAALEAVAGDVEATHRVPVEVVAVGEAALDEHGEALVAAAREAIVNAAKHGGGEPVRVFAEATPDGVEVFVRDRGPGFDPGAVPGDRRGVRESIVGRMARHGGTATIHSAPGVGTEVELTLPRETP